MWMVQVLSVRSLHALFMYVWISSDSPKNKKLSMFDMKMGTDKILINSVSCRDATKMYGPSLHIHIYVV